MFVHRGVMHMLAQGNSKGHLFVLGTRVRGGMPSAASSLSRLRVRGGCEAHPRRVYLFHYPITPVSAEATTAFLRMARSGVCVCVCVCVCVWCLRSSCVLAFVRAKFVRACVRARVRACVRGVCVRQGRCASTTRTRPRSGAGSTATRARSRPSTGTVRSAPEVTSLERPTRSHPEAPDRDSGP